LAGLDVREVARGDVVADVSAALEPTYVIDVVLELHGDGRQLEHGTRVQVHHGTRESPARVAELGGRFWQLRLERPLVAAAGDRFVVRQIAPPDTLGGGEVLDAHARKHGPSRDALARLERLARGEPESESEPAPPRAAEPPPEPAPLSAAALA